MRAEAGYILASALRDWSDMPDVNLERLQRLAQSRWGLDLPGALRMATGLRMDINGIARYIGGYDLNAGLPLTDTLEEILEETQVLQGFHGRNTLNTGTLVSKVLTDAEPGHTIVVSSDAGTPRALAPTATAAHTSNMRWAFQVPGVTGTDWEVTYLCSPMNTGVNPGSGAIAAQAGVGVRFQEDVDRRLILANNNIAYGSAVQNYSVWRCALDGTGFVNRQFSSGAAFTNPAFPYWVKFRLIGTVMETWIWGANEGLTDRGVTNRHRIGDLDVDAGSLVGNATPVGSGGLVVVAAHLGNNVQSEVRWPQVMYRVLD